MPYQDQTDRIHLLSAADIGLVSVSEEASTLEEVHEPFLIQEGFLKRTPKGRVATLKSYEKLGLSPN